MSCFLSIVLAIVLHATPTAMAHDSHVGPDHNQIHGLRVDLHGNLDGWGMLGGGARFEFAIVPNGFIGGNVHDEFALSFGADLLAAPTYMFGWSGYGGGAYVAPIAAAQWNFYLGDRWSVFPEAGLAVHVGLDHGGWYDKNGHTYGWVYAMPDVGIGARYHFNGSVALLMRISTPGGLQVGVVF